MWRVDKLIPTGRALNLCNFFTRHEPCSAVGLSSTSQRGAKPPVCFLGAAGSEASSEMIVKVSPYSDHPVYIYLHSYLLPVRNEYQERSGGLSPPAASGSMQTSTAAPGPASLFPSEAPAR